MKRKKVTLKNMMKQKNPMKKIRSLRLKKMMALKFMMKKSFAICVNLNCKKLQGTLKLFTMNLAVKS